MTVRHLTLMRAGIYAALPYFVFGISQPLGGWLSDALIRRGFDETATRKAVITIAFLSGVMLIPAATAKTAVGALGFLVAGSFAGLSGGNMAAILQTCAPPSEVGVWSGFNNFGGNIGGILAPSITGMIIARTGSYVPAFNLAAGVLAMGIVAYVFVVRKVVPPQPLAEEAS